MSNEQALREAAGIERAAAWIDKRRNDYMDEHGSHDPETGGTELSRAGQEYVGELDEIAEGLRSLLPCDRPPSGWYCTRQRGHAGPCAALALPASAHGAEPSDAEIAGWLHEEDRTRVVSASQKAQALKDGGASASSLRAYSIPLARWGAGAPPAAVGDYRG